MGLNFNKIFSAERAVIGAVITIASLIAVAFAVYFHFEGKFVEAKSAATIHQQMQTEQQELYQQMQSVQQKLQEEIKLTGVRLSVKILEDRIAGLQNRIWRYVERYGPNCGVHHRICEQWKAEIAVLERELQRIR